MHVSVAELSLANIWQLSVMRVVDVVLRMACVGGAMLTHLSMACCCLHLCRVLHLPPAAAVWGLER
jgi:hypothetical protein